jgi:tRNA-dihydrouridine synthase 1
MPPTLKGYEFYEKSLKSARHVVAPMVDASELAWRMLARKYGADLCFTPMWHSGVFVRNEKYRQNALQSCAGDRPLIVQFCANDPDIFRKAVAYTVDMVDCDAIDLNLGCPQVIAKRGHFGSYLQDDWELVRKLIAVIHDNFSVPITAKLRVFDDLEKTIAYAKMMESAGAQMLTVHGRTREQKGALTGVASWKHIKAIKEAVSIPVIANGNIQYFADVDTCLKETGVDGVMAAEGQLTNPALFSGNNPPVWTMCEEYLDLVEKYPCPLGYSRGHLFKMLHHVLQMKDNFDVRQLIAKGQNLSVFRGAVATLKERLLPYHEGKSNFVMPEEVKARKLRFPPWICQPYVRPPPEEHLKKVAEICERDKLARAAEKRVAEAELGVEEAISKNKLKKMDKNPNKNFPHARESCKICVTCPNPSSQRCEYGLCRQCCKTKCFNEELDCSGHGIQVKTKRELARARVAAGFPEICITCPNPRSQRCGYGLCKQCCKTKCLNEELDCSGHGFQVKTKRELARARVAAGFPAAPENNDTVPPEVKP